MPADSESHAPDQHDPAAPPSPCINVCVLDGTGHCIGCLRTGDEIARWRDMNAREQWSLIEQLAERRKARDQSDQGASGTGSPGGGVE